MSITPTAENGLLKHARQMLDEPTPSTVSAWSRAAALLTRQALEEALASYWSRRLPGAEWMNMRAQLNTADVMLGRDVGGRLRYLWYALSRATHHHAYELDPTREELGWMIDSTEEIIPLLGPGGDDRVLAYP